MNKLAMAAVAVAAFVSAPAAAVTVPINIAASNNGGNPFWTVSTTFNLPVGFSGAMIAIDDFNADDRAVLTLNGTIVANTGIFGPGSGSMVLTLGGPNNPFTFTSGNGGSWPSVTAGFVTGVNSLEIIVNDTFSGIFGNLAGGAAGPTSTSLDAVLTYNVSAGVPEPSTWALMLIGFAGLGVAAMRRGRAATA